MLNLDLVKLMFIQKLQPCIEKFTCSIISLPKLPVQVHPYTYTLTDRVTLVSPWLLWYCLDDSQSTHAVHVCTGLWALKPCTSAAHP